MKKMIMLIMAIVLIAGNVFAQDIIARRDNTEKAVDYREVITVKDINDVDVQIYNGQAVTFTQRTLDRQRANIEAQKVSMDERYVKTIAKLDSIQAELDK